MKPFLLSWNAAQTAVLQKEVLAYLDSRPEVRNWLVPFLGVVLIVAEETHTASGLAALIRSRFPGLNFAVAPVETRSTDGWMPSSFWDFIREPKSSGRWPEHSLESILAGMVKARRNSPDTSLSSLADLLGKKTGK